jgi:hypothetical protein
MTHVKRKRAQACDLAENGDNHGRGIPAADVMCPNGTVRYGRRTSQMGRISVDTMHWRNNSNLSGLEIDVGTLFRAGALFTARGFSHSTIKALVLGGIDAPEHLLFADEAELLSIAGLGEGALEEIARYRAQFAGAPRKLTRRGLDVGSPVPQGSRLPLCQFELATARDRGWQSYMT